MDRKIRIAQWGVGKMGKIMVRYAVQHGGEMVAGLVHSAKDASLDLGTVCGIEPLGVLTQTSDNALEILKETRPDIVLIATRGSMQDLREPLLTCAAAKVNALTIGEQALWPWTEAPEITREIDEAFKAAGVTCSASGCPEVAWGSLASTLAGSCARIDRILVTGNLNLEDYGKLEFLYTNHGVGLTVEEFEKKFCAYDGMTVEEINAAAAASGEPIQGDYLPCYPGDQNGWLCAYMGLHITRQYAKNIPYVYDKDVYSANLEKTIPAGNVLGASKIVVSETEEGVTVEFGLAGRVYTPEDKDRYAISIFGEPNTTIIMDTPDTPVFTCATPVNRIPDVMNARPGFVTTEEFPRNMYRSRPLNEYVLD